MKVLFLPNFPVYKVMSEDPHLHPANQMISPRRYWFFKYWPDTTVEVIDSKWAKLTFSQQLKALRKLLKDENEYDLIISHHYLSAFLLSSLRSIIGKKMPPHVVFDIACLTRALKNLPIASTPTIYTLTKLSVRSISGIIYHSKINEEFYSKYTPEVPRKFVYFGEDPEVFKPLDNLPSEDYILSFGYAKREYTTLIKVWKKYKLRIPLKIVGKTDFRIKLPRNVKTYPKVDLLTLKKFIHNAKFIILPIENELYSVGQMSLLGSMAMEKAVIVNKVPGVIDYVEDGKNALFTTYKSETDLKNKIRYLLDNPSEITRLGKNARKLVIKKFNIKNMSIEVLKFVQELIGE